MELLIIGLSSLALVVAVFSLFVARGAAVTAEEAKPPPEPEPPPKPRYIGGKS